MRGRIIPFKPEVLTEPTLRHMITASVELSSVTAPVYVNSLSVLLSKFIALFLNLQNDPFGDLKAAGDPYCTSHLTTEDTLREAMSKYGKVKSLCLIRHIVTGASRGYAFVEYETEGDASCLQGTTVMLTFFFCSLELLDMYIFCFNSGVSLFARKECSFVVVFYRMLIIHLLMVERLMLIIIGSN
uniref:RRM domain-containing protein n=1 Tax=Brassica oleracea TaxID=3712 RepID=A0A3P6EWL0_BRAOL|nr:unnamed protein product [Brassica oleracea]